MTFDIAYSFLECSHQDGCTMPCGSASLLGSPGLPAWCAARRLRSAGWRTAQRAAAPA